ncbi:MAG: putative feruloyl esterase B-2 [Geoglossum simile]|nr:MAG: putative feruloyl esterase B-2 [Geoglossum simile]
MWLPRNWSGRFLGTGNGGLDGCIKYEDLAYATSNGFASVGTNNGHNGTSGVAFYNNPDILEDFAYRSLHTSVLVGKKLVQEFYHCKPYKSYYIGCSLGGRQGLRSAEKYPDDFDGIVAGSPALDFNNLISWRASFYPITGAVDSPNFITAPTWAGLIHSEILNQCDGIDGVMDGIIEDPTLCHFRPEVLQCTNTTTADCLSANQVEQIRKIFAPFVGDDGGLIYPGMQPGSEGMAINRLYAGKPYENSDDWFKYVVYSNPSWNAANFSLTDACAAEELNPFDIRTWPSDLSPFADRKGKIIAYHGQQDNQITSFITTRFYKHLSRGMSAPPEVLDQFFRFFRISGMFHCNSGPGGWVIGQGGGVQSAGVPFNGRQSVLAALVEWVEEGKAPEMILGTKFVNDTVGLGALLQRGHCR